MDVSPLCWCTVGSINWSAVSAIGTIVALIVAILAPIWHSKRVQLEQERQRIRTLSALVSFAADTVDAFEDFAPQAADVASPGRPSIAMVQLRHALEAVPVHELPDDRLVYPVLAIRQDVITIESWFTRQVTKTAALAAATAIRAEIDTVITVDREFHLPWIVRRPLWTGRSIAAAWRRWRDWRKQRSGRGNAIISD